MNEFIRNLMEKEMKKVKEVKKIEKKDSKHTLSVRP
jgi:hypothetical protein